MSERRARAAFALALSLSAAACATAPAEPGRAQSYADFLVGRLADLRQDDAAAAEHYYEALRRTPTDAALTESALNAALAANDVSRARAIAQLAGAHHVAAPRANLVLAVDALGAGRWRQARDLALHVRGGAVEDLEQRMLLIWARTGEGHVDDGLAQVGDAGAARPFTGLFAYQRAMALDYAGRTQEALAAYEDAEQGGMWLPPAIERYADLLARTGAKDRALAVLSRNDGRQTNPGVVALVQRIAAGQPSGLPPLTPARGAAIGFYGFAAVLLQEAEPTDGLGALSLALMLDDGLDAARLSYAEAQVDLGHPDAAQAALARIPALSPYAESAKVMQAWVLLGEGRKDEAVALAEANAQGGGPRAQRALADIYRNVERYADAEPLYTALIGQRSNDWGLYFARGAVRERLSRWPEAEADLRHALELSPEQPEVLNYLGYSYVERGENLPDALAMVQHAAELRPQSGAIVDSVGWAYFKLEDYEQAVSYLEHAVELDPSDFTINDHLGDAYWRAGRRIEARFQWRRALAVEPDETTRPGLEAKIADGLPSAPPAARAATR